MSTRIRPIVPLAAAMLLLALAALPTIPEAAHGQGPAAGTLGLRAEGPEPIAIEDAAILHGAGAEEYYFVYGAGDANGDGASDLVTAYMVRPRAPNAETWFFLLPGRRDWPSQAARDEIPGAVPIVSSQTGARRILPERPNFYLGNPPLVDVDLDGTDDVIVYELVSAGAAFSWSARVYYGRPELWAELDVNTIEPDLEIRQPRVRLTEGALETTPVPDYVLPGDFDGDGSGDLLVVSCGLRGKRFRRGDEGAWYLYFGRGAPLADIDLSRDAPDSIVYGTTDDGRTCRGDAPVEGQSAPAFAVFDLDGDARDDLLYTGWDERKQQAEVRYLPAPARWEAEMEAQDLIAARFVASDFLPEGPYRPRVVPDLNGDEIAEILLAGRGLWFGGAAPSGDYESDTADIRIENAVVPSDGVLDVQGDGQRDIALRVDRRSSRDPVEWRILAGPLSSLGGIDPRHDPLLGDYLLSIPAPPLLDYLPQLWVADFTGDGHSDVVISSPSENSPRGDREAGVIRLLAGPLVGPRVLPTPSPEPGTGCSDVFEPDDTTSTAAVLFPSGKQDHTLDKAGDVDTVRFTLPAGAWILRTLDLSPRTDTRLELLDAGGRRVLATNDDTRGIAPASSIRFETAITTSYFARVTDIDPLTASCARSYAIAVEAAP